MEKLPEKWCIKTTPKTREMINNFFKTNGYTSIWSSDWYAHYPLIFGGCAYDLIKDGYTEITFEQFEKFILNKNMENKSIKINIPEGMEIDKEKSTFEEIVFKIKEKKLPETWEELKEVKGYYVDSYSNIMKSNTRVNDSNKNLFPTKELAEAALALAQLLQLRDVYNDGWIPDYENGFEGKYVIITYNNKLLLSTDYNFTNAILAFKTKKLRNEFYDNFISLLETAKPLL